LQYRLTQFVTIALGVANLTLVIQFAVYKMRATVALFYVASRVPWTAAFVARRPGMILRLYHMQSSQMLPTLPISDFHLDTTWLTALDSPPETAGISYSKASYYTVLGLYLLSFPGLWSTVKRSTTAKIKRKTFIQPGEKSVSEKAKNLRQQAGEIMACKLHR
jgi:hypothetical protein